MCILTEWGSMRNKSERLPNRYTAL